MNTKRVIRIARLLGGALSQAAHDGDPDVCHVDDVLLGMAHYAATLLATAHISNPALIDRELAMSRIARLESYMLETFDDCAQLSIDELSPQHLKD